MDSSNSNMAANAICFAADMARQEILYTASAIAEAWTRPSVLYKPHLSRDGNAWCVLLGDDLQSGIAGFGSTPAEAMAAFDTAWKGVT